MYLVFLTVTLDGYLNELVKLMAFLFSLYRLRVIMILH